MKRGDFLYFCLIFFFLDLLFLYFIFFVRQIESRFVTGTNDNVHVKRLGH